VVPVLGVLAFVSVLGLESLLLVSDLDSELLEVGELAELASEPFSGALALLLE
jgi:hypothetical protein